MKGIYLEVGDTLQIAEKKSYGEIEMERVQCVEQAGCNGCYFRPENCEFLVCLGYERLDGKSVIFTKVDEKGGEK